MFQKQLRGFALLLLMIPLLAQAAYAANEERQFHILYNDNRIVFEEVQPVLIDGVTLVPFRKVFETLGFEVSWVPETREVGGTKDGMSIGLTIDRSTAKVNGKDVALEVPAQILDGSTLVPLRFVSENSGKKVDYKFEGSALRIWIADIGKMPTKDASAHVVSCGKGTSTVQGRILAPQSGIGIPGATVYLQAADCRATTDAEGAFTFEEVSAQEDKLVATRGRFKVESAIAPGKTAEVQLSQGQLKIAYMEGSYDHAEAVVEELGYKADLISFDELTEKRLSDYHIIFLNCGLHDTFSDAHLDVLRNWVAKGGALYLSDLSGSELERLYPEKVKFIGSVGVIGEAKATLEEQSFKTALKKSETTIVFDLSSWMVIDSVSSDTEVLVRGDVEYEGYLTTIPQSADWEKAAKDMKELDKLMELLESLQNSPDLLKVWEEGAEAEMFKEETTKDNRPLAVRFQQGQGQVTYTSFHEEAQMSGEMKTIMQNLILGL